MDNFEKKVEKSIKKFNLIGKNEKILVACSGGKDSTSLLYVLHKLGYKVEAIMIDPLIGEYTKKNLENLKKVCKEWNVKLHTSDFRKEFGYSLCYLKSTLKSKGHNLNNCAICGVLRRYLLNKHARKLGFKKIATGHNLDDEAQSIIMNLFKNNLEILARLGPITGLVKDKKFVSRIKPFYLISEEEIKKYSKKMKFPVNYAPCPCRKGVYRCVINELLTKYENKFLGTHENIVNWFLEISPLLKKEFKPKLKQNYCKNCGEPSKDNICMTCCIIEKIK